MHTNFPNPKRQPTKLNLHIIIWLTYLFVRDAQNIYAPQIEIDLLFLLKKLGLGQELSLYMAQPYDPTTLSFHMDVGCEFERNQQSEIFKIAFTIVIYFSRITSQIFTVPNYLCWTSLWTDCANT